MSVVILTYQLSRSGHEPKCGKGMFVLARFLDLPNVFLSTTKAIYIKQAFYHFEADYQIKLLVSLKNLSDQLGPGDSRKCR